MNPKLLQGRLETSIADLVGSEELAPVVHDRRFVGRHAGKIPLVAHSIDEGVAQAFLPAGRSSLHA